MSSYIEEEFEPLSSKKWKQQIQYELKGADYNETLVWEGSDGIKVKPFYHKDEDNKTTLTTAKEKPFQILQAIFVHDEVASNHRAKDVLSRGAEAVYFTVEHAKLEVKKILDGLPKSNPYFFYLPFLDIDFVTKSKQFADENGYILNFQIDPIHHFVTEGNWHYSQESDLGILTQLATLDLSFLTIKGRVYQEAGATVVQEIAYILAHLAEYGNTFSYKQELFIELSIGSNYFFEIAKCRALQWLCKSVLKEYDFTQKITLLTTPTKRNKTIYDYNVNMLRTTTEYMSSIIGGADYIMPLAYDSIYHKDNEFGDRIARNQLLILKSESFFDKVSNPADGSYYIETLTQQIAEKALQLFKDIELKGGFLAQLHNGTIQKSIQESHQREENEFLEGKKVLIGTNKYPNSQDSMKDDLELYPFLKQNPRKTLIVPILERRIAEITEKQRLEKE